MRTESTQAIARLEMLYFCMASKKNTVFALQNPKLALPLQCYKMDSNLSRSSAVNARHIRRAFFMPRHLIALRLPSENLCARERLHLFCSNGLVAVFLSTYATKQMQYERIDPVGHTPPRPSRDPHRSQIPGPVHNPVARTPRRNHAVPADGISHPHRRSRPLGNRGHVELAVVRHDGGCHAVAHAGRVVGCRPRLGSIGITDFNNGRR